MRRSMSRSTVGSSSLSKSSSSDRSADTSHSSAGSGLLLRTRSTSVPVDPSCLESGRSSETVVGSVAASRTRVTFTPIASASSSSVAERPSCAVSTARACLRRMRKSWTYTGSRIVRDWQASARVTPCRIQWVAYVAKRSFRSGSNRSVARIKPRLPSWMRSSIRMPLLVYRLAIQTTSLRLLSSICSRAASPRLSCCSSSAGARHSAAEVSSAVGTRPRLRSSSCCFARSASARRISRASSISCSCVSMRLEEMLSMYHMIGSDEGVGSAAFRRPRGEAREGEASASTSSHGVSAVCGGAGAAALQAGWRTRAARERVVGRMNEPARGRRREKRRAAHARPRCTARRMGERAGRKGRAAAEEKGGRAGGEGEGRRGAGRESAR
mmetsp:Transcript_5868/g.14890  ORF Transcript_5868/g.14890 Transcript_5868/m.14890 type:complete len:384 (+) Transcript_5868:664-1815(+)